jgi:hypothetical protein
MENARAFSNAYLFAVRILLGPSLRALQLARSIHVSFFSLQTEQY